MRRSADQPLDKLRVNGLEAVRLPAFRERTSLEIVAGMKPGAVVCLTSLPDATAQKRH